MRARMRLHVTNEIGRLKSVLVHLPGREIDVMVPPMMNQLLFDDILYGQVAREEHRRFQQVIRFVAPDVIDMQDLLEEAFADETTRDEIVRDFARRNKLNRRLTAWLHEQRAAALAEILIGGIPSEKESSGNLPKFDLLPVPNFFFMRDPQVVVGPGIVLCGMATQARRRESLLSKYVFRYHPAFREPLPFLVDFMATESPERTARSAPTLEGGDILVARRDLLLVGLSERTNRAGVRELARSLKDAGSGIETMIVVELPRQRSFMHLDTVFTFISPHECLIYPPVVLPGGDEAARVTSADLTQKTIRYTEQKSLLAALRKQDIDVEPIYCGGR
jgi:arginine deiminase